MKREAKKQKKQIAEPSQEVVFSAKGKRLGRLATEVAHALMNKGNPAFRRHLAGNIKVVIHDAEKLGILSKKIHTKRYAHYSGYPGGLRHKKMTEIIETKGHGEVIRRAVYGMLPANKLRKVRMKNLSIM